MPLVRRFGGLRFGGPFFSTGMRRTFVSLPFCALRRQVWLWLAVASAVK